MKVVSRRRIGSIVKNLRKLGKSIVFTNGCFDIIHAGHIRLLRKCRQLGDCVIVGLNSDESIRRLKGRARPINNLKDRIEVLSSIEYVDYIVVFDDDTPYDLIREIMPDYLVKGGDYSLEEVIGREFAKKVIIVKLLPGRSTTDIVKKIEKGVNK